MRRGSRGPDVAPGRWSQLEGVAAVVLLACAMAPLIGVVVTRTGRTYVPVGDIAIIDLRVREVWSRDLPLVGAYSRLGWSHPGPLMYLVLAPFSALAGGAAHGTLVGHAAIQAGAVAWTAWLAWRRGRLPMVALWLGLSVLAYAATGPWMLLEPWNPHIVFPFLVLLLLQAWLVATGDHRCFVAMAFVASFLVQGHIGYVPIVAAVVLWALVRLRGEVHRAGGRLRELSVWRPTVVVLTLVWALPLLETVVHWPGNAYYVARAFVTGGGQGEPVGEAAGLGLLAGAFRVVPPWLGGPDDLEPLTQVAQPSSVAWLMVPTALLAAAFVTTRHHPRGSDHRLVVVVVVALAAGAATITRVTGEPAPYLFYWRLALGPAAVLVPLWVLLDVRPGRVRATVRRAAVAVLAAGVVAGSFSLARQVADHPDAVDPMETVTEDLLDQALADGRPDDPVLVRVAGTTLGGLESAVANELDRRGVDVRIDRRRPFPYGYHRFGVPATVDEVWFTTVEGHELSLLTDLPGARVIARTEGLPAAEEAELVALQRKLAGQLHATGDEHLIPLLSRPLGAFQLGDVSALDPDDVQRLTELNEQAATAAPCRCAIVAFHPDDAPCRRPVRIHAPADDLAEECVGHA